MFNAVRRLCVLVRVARTREGDTVDFDSTQVYICKYTILFIRNTKVVWVKFGGPYFIELPLFQLPCSYRCSGRKIIHVLEPCWVLLAVPAALPEGIAGDQDIYRINTLSYCILLPPHVV